MFASRRESRNAARRKVRLRFICFWRVELPRRELAEDDAAVLRLRQDAVADDRRRRP